MTERYINLQILRAIAALIVVVNHGLWIVPGVDEAALAYSITGRFGVTIFFVISGFIIHHANVDKFERAGAPADFLWSRSWRIVPLYWCCTTAYLILSLVVPSAVSSGHVDALHLLGSYLFIPFDHRNPIYAIGWSLNYEAMFYVAFAAVLGFSERKGLLLLLGGLVALMLLHPFVPQQSALVDWTSDALAAFVAGILLSLLARRVSWRAPAAAFWAAMLVLLGYSSLEFTEIELTARDWWQTAVAALFVAAAIFTRAGDLFGIGAALGDASYSLYLLHLFVIRALVLVAPPLPWPLLLAMAIGASVVAALLSYRWLELPALTFGRRLRHILRAQPTTAGARG